MYKITISFWVIILFLGQYMLAQSVLDTYIKEGIESNLALKQKQINYKNSVLALKEAKGMFFPEITFEARYSVADGGRIIEIPIGDYVNPYTSTINEFFQMFGITQDVFPEYENEEIPFLRAHEQETKVRLKQAVFSPAVYYNYKIKSESTQLELISIDQYKRELIAEIKKAYYNYLQTTQILLLFDETMELLEENHRVSQSLYENQKVTIDVVYRSESEISKLEQKHAEAIKAGQLAAAYFNFLLNKPYNAEIEILQQIDTQKISIGVDEAILQMIQTREELKQIQTYQSINNHYIKLNKSMRLPAIYGIVDYGIQGEEYRFTDQDDFVIAALALRWTLFNGLQNKAKIQQAQLNQELLDVKFEEVKKQLNLQVINAYYDLEASKKAIISAQKQSKAADKAFYFMKKKYKLGQINLLQFIDARTNMTNAKHNLIMKQYDYKVKMAEFEKVTGLIDLKNY